MSSPILPLIAAILMACATPAPAPAPGFEPGSCELGGKVVRSGYEISDGCNTCFCDDGSAACTAKACQLQVTVTVAFAPGVVEPSVEARESLDEAAEALTLPALEGVVVELLRAAGGAPEMASERLRAVRIHLVAAGVADARLREGVDEGLAVDAIAVRTPLVDQPPVWGDPQIRR